MVSAHMPGGSASPSCRICERRPFPVFDMQRSETAPALLQQSGILQTCFIHAALPGFRVANFIRILRVSRCGAHLGNKRPFGGEIVIDMHSPPDMVIAYTRKEEKCLAPSSGPDSPSAIFTLSFSGVVLVCVDSAYCGLITRALMHLPNIQWILNIRFPYPPEPE